jgi:tryptophan synthase beta chain
MTSKDKMKEYFTTLSLDETPTSWYNIQADLPEPAPPPLDPTTIKPISPNLLERIFAKELIGQEVSTERYIKIPDEVFDAYLRLPRPQHPYTAQRDLKNT